ncbi:putative uncharacterized protein DDB_G0271606 [Trichogramma pretiosum]|uniref:putative uncharacterized protein DDB_G0271606 n=1 Tax=Trichogramma pretiosum TaxID=7493 RepID=UPI0006C966F2|nr:putative uncharacterized protein DDB_G0271606 [Trichogramma pretiosum]
MSSSGYNKFAMDEMKFRGEDSHHHCSDAQGNNRNSRPTSKAQATNSSAPDAGGKSQIRFTPQMLQDQELLVSTMSQQGIPETLIKRHFDRLLEEQCKQIQVLETSCLVQEQPINNNNHRLSGGGEAFYREQQQQQQQAVEQQRHQMQYHHQQQQQQQEEEGVDTRPAEPHQQQQQQPKPRLEPSSLVRMRLEKEAKLLSHKNNGLQELAVAQEILSSNKYGHLSRNQCRLDGTQDSEDMDRISREMGLRHEQQERSRKKPSSNGLENSRRAGNPPPNSRSHALRQLLLAQEQPVVYPPQRGDSSIYCNRQRELGCCEQPQQQQQQQPQQQPQTYANEQHKRQEVYELQKMQQHHQFQTMEQQQRQQLQQQQHQQQQQQPQPTAAPMYQQQQQTHSNDLLEPRIIGGVTYLARKQQCIPQIPGFISDDYSNVRATTI